ncbi:selenium cofactor biosynthesis protein YqeC [Clostridioides mangenotii]|uniref:selenium cofactor biosynthesis protein YqeC n=1 Tax=Metaclostridioides mangenotii TaxID=1540 RepID=UPI00214A369E|nr:selenium cofactor biosynthesis protein YqeC [Clostridioides mangenotii]MCR1954245.1 selenium cofactor biosynthesis protein YqeC [Clostridioides mangenotii]
MNFKNLIDINPNINKKEVITVVGAGGKTSFIDYIAQLYRHECRVMLTTTTKIFVPHDGSYEKIIMLDKTDRNDLLNIDFEVGITVCGKFINKDKKIVGLDFEDFKLLEDKFDLILIEGDGSKRKKLKGWNDNEPAVYEKTTKTIGILDITSYNMKINEENIHRLDKFIETIGYKHNKYKKLNKEVDIQDLAKIVLSKDGLFKNAVGEKVLFINKVENKNQEDTAKVLIKIIRIKDSSIKFYYGSLKQNYIKQYI